MRKKYPVFKTLKRIINEVVKKDRGIIFAFIIFTLIAGILPMFPVYFPKLIIDTLLITNVDINYLVTIIIAFTIFTALLGFLDRVINYVIQPRITMVRIDLLTATYNKLNNLDYRYTEDPKFLDVHEDALEATANSSNGFEGIMTRMFSLGGKLLTLIFYIVIISRLSYLVLVALLVSVTVSIITSVLAKKFRYKNKEKLAHASRKIRYFSNMTHDFSYGKDIRLFNFQERIQDSYHYEIKSYVSVYRKVKNKEYFLGFIDLLFVLVSDSFLYYILITKVLGGMSISLFSMYLVTAVALSTLLKVIGEDFSFIVGEGQYVRDYYTFMETEFNLPTGNIKGVEDDTLEIEFKNVSFKYPNTEKWIIKDLNLKIEKGEKLAIIGVNGAGKTTLVKLITRLFDPTNGEILVNGKNAKEYDKEEYQKLFSTVFQDVNVLAFTVRENITLGLSNDEMRIWEALAKVGLKDKVQGFEKGLDQMMLKNIDEEGVVLSGGENQKLAIARALYKDGKAIILDEPTAALDALAEAKIYEEFNDLIGNKTAIYISHRLASTKFCDRVAFFKDSRLSEYGHHDELMNLKGDYYQMFIVQGKYYQEETLNEEN